MLYNLGVNPLRENVQKKIKGGVRDERRQGRFAGVSGRPNRGTIPLHSEIGIFHLMGNDRAQDVRDSRGESRVEYFRYHGTNCFFIRSDSDDRLLAVDAGWPCTLDEYWRGLKSIGLQYRHITWAIVTHFHMDHAGLVNEFIESGIECLIFENQAGAVDGMERTIRKNYPRYRNIDAERLAAARTNESREMLKAMGIRGEVIVTDGHSADSITLITDSREAIIGDLPPRERIMPDDEKCLACWRRIEGMGARRIYPSHAAIFEL
jgi:endoribonuclease LACTB2